MVHDALKCQLREKEEALSEAPVKLTAGSIELDELPLKKTKIEGEFTFAETNVSLQTT